jgi:hypothetical protein
MGMHAIETIYDGHRFRSRIEAKWAVFFKSLALPYHYEPEGFNFDGSCYLPDFWIPSWKSYVEIKWEKPSLEELGKAELLNAQLGKNLLLVYGEPWPKKYNVIPFGSHQVLMHADGTMLQFMQCRRCTNIFLVSIDDSDTHWAGSTIGHPTAASDCRGCSDRYPLIHNEIERAFSNAMTARFEHGECPP